MEKEKIYVVSLTIMDDDESTTAVLGAFDDKEDACQFAHAEVDDRYAHDLQDASNNDEEELELDVYLTAEEWLDSNNKTYAYGYHSNVDFYNVEVTITEVELNAKNYKLAKL